MKRIVTAFGIGAMLFSSTVAVAGVAFTWDGGGISDSWCDSNNWAANSLFPGEGQTSDIATITDSTRTTCLVDCSIPSNPANDYGVYGVWVDAENANADMTLQITTGGSLNVINGGSGYIRLTAGTHGAGGNIADDASLWVADGTLNVDNIDCEGGFKDSTRGDRGLARLLFDVAPTINDDVTVTGEANFVVNADTTIGGKLIVGNSNYYGDLVVSGNGTLYDDLTIQAPNQDGKDAILQSNGSIDVTGTTYVIASESHDADATLWVSGGTFTTDAIEFDGSEDPSKGHAIGDFDVDVSVDGIGGTDTTLKGYVELKVDTSVEFGIQETKVDSPNTHAEVIGVGEVIATTLTIDADAASDARKLTKLGNGKFRTISTVTVKSDLDVANDAEIEVSAGTFELYAFTFEGSTNDTGHAIGDFDVGVTVSSSTTILGYVDIDIADSTTLDLNDLTMVANSADMEVTGHSSVGTSTLRLDSYTGNSRPLSLVGPLMVEIY